MLLCAHVAARHCQMHPCTKSCCACQRASRQRDHHVEKCSCSPSSRLRTDLCRMLSHTVACSLSHTIACYIACYHMPSHTIACHRTLHLWSSTTLVIDDCTVSVCSLSFQRNITCTAHDAWAAHSIRSSSHHSAIICCHQSAHAR